MSPLIVQNIVKLTIIKRQNPRVLPSSRFGCQRRIVGIVIRYSVDANIETTADNSKRTGLTISDGPCLFHSSSRTAVISFCESWRAALWTFLRPALSRELFSSAKPNLSRIERTVLFSRSTFRKPLALVPLGCLDSSYFLER